MEIPEDANQKGMEFAVLARHFCDLVAKADQFDQNAFFKRVASSLAELYYRATQLDDKFVDSSPVGSDSAPWPSEHRAVLERYFDDNDLYWVVFDPKLFPHGEAEPVIGSLADDLNDIAAELANGLSLLEREVPIAAVIWEWKLTFTFHWGRHLVQALAAIHARIYE